MASIAFVIAMLLLLIISPIASFFILHTIIDLVDDLWHKREMREADEVIREADELIRELEKGYKTGRRRRK